MHIIPFCPVNPIKPCGPWSPGKPWLPCLPCSPFKPAAPWSPLIPWGPGAPSTKLFESVWIQNYIYHICDDLPCCPGKPCNPWNDQQTMILSIGINIMLKIISINLQKLVRKLQVSLRIYQDIIQNFYLCSDWPTLASTSRCTRLAGNTWNSSFTSSTWLTSRSWWTYLIIYWLNAVTNFIIHS